MLEETHKVFGVSISTIRTWEKQLLPALPPGSVAVMDNASFHRKAQLICIA